MKTAFQIIGFILVVVAIVWLLIAAFQHWDVPEAMVSPHQKLIWYGRQYLMMMIGAALIKLNED